MTRGKCDVEDCDSDIKVRTWCNRHYLHWYRHGDPLAGNRRIYATPEESFAARTSADGDCVVWTGTETGNGYGIISVPGRQMLAHRYAWERENGPIPEGMDIDHTCWNRLCVKVGHLRVATRGQNLQNLQGARTDSVSGIRGVRYSKPNRTWVSEVKVAGVVHTERSRTVEEAARKVVEMRRRLMPFSQEREIDYDTHS